jgi:1,4-dihydroxy-2-naphthoyl-CoA hydrolase
MTNPKITAAAAAERLHGFFPGDLGIELTHIDDEEVRGRMPVDRRHLHPGGYVHGGAWTAFADTLAAWGTMRHLPDGAAYTTAELKMNLFAGAADGDELIGVGRPLHAGRRSQAWEVRVYVSGRDRLAALFVCTQMVLS